MTNIPHSPPGMDVFRGCYQMLEEDDTRLLDSLGARDVTHLLHRHRNALRRLLS